MATAQQIETYCKTNLVAFGYTNTVIRSLPVYNKNYDTLPMCCVSPMGRPKMGPVAFGHNGQDIGIKLVYFQSTLQDNTTPIGATTFLEDCNTIFNINAFQSFPSNLPSGVWQIKVGEATEFKGNLLLQGYAGTEIVLTFSTVTN